MRAIHKIGIGLAGLVENLMLAGPGALKLASGGALGYHSFGATSISTSQVVSPISRREG